MTEHANELQQEQQMELLAAVKKRFAVHMHRHEEINWLEVEQKLMENPTKLRSLHEMERTGGEPDIIGFDSQTGEYLFYDCSPESPSGRRSVCYDEQALESRKKNKPETSAEAMAEMIGIELLDEKSYRHLQKLGTFDKKTSSWIKTPDDIRKAGGALFCDFRYGHVFVYHNGADSYYAARGFRGMLRV